MLPLQLHSRHHLPPHQFMARSRPKTLLAAALYQEQGNGQPQQEHVKTPLRLWSRMHPLLTHDSVHRHPQ